MRRFSTVQRLASNLLGARAAYTTNAFSKNIAPEIYKAQSLNTTFAANAIKSMPSSFTSSFAAMSLCSVRPMSTMYTTTGGALNVANLPKAAADGIAAKIPEHSIRGHASKTLGITDGEAVKRVALAPLLLTIALGLVFTACQVLEYYESPLTMQDGWFGSIFYAATGTHGIHVLIGTIFLIVQAYRMFRGHFSATHHLGFQLAAWYWHFVDVVWLFVLVTFYDFS